MRKFRPTHRWSRRRAAKSAFPTLASYKYEFDRHARRARGVTRPRARRSRSKPVKRQRRLHSESRRVREKRSDLPFHRSTLIGGGSGAPTAVVRKNLQLLKVED